MKALFETALAWLRWGWDHVIRVSKVILAKLKVVFDTVVDPPPRTIRFFFWSATAAIFAVWCVFAFANSWFYRPTVEALSSFSWSLGGDDLDVELPAAKVEPKIVIPSVVVTTLPPPETKKCEDMSDTPHCPELPPESKSGGNVEVSDVPVPVAKASKVRKAHVARRAKFKPYETVWGF